MALDERVVRDALKTVNDPEIGKDLVTLNMVGEIQVEGARSVFGILEGHDSGFGRWRGRGRVVVREYDPELFDVPDLVVLQREGILVV